MRRILTRRDSGETELRSKTEEVATFEDSKEAYGSHKNFFVIQLRLDPPREAATLVRTAPKQAVER
jgi:hypothetical protein